MAVTGRSVGRRRAPASGVILCAAVTSILLLLSAVVLYTRLGRFSLSIGRRGLRIQAPNKFDPIKHHNGLTTLPVSEQTSQKETLISTLVADDRDKEDELPKMVKEDPIDEFDFAEEVGDEDEKGNKLSENKRSGFFWDHVIGVKRRAFDKQIIDEDHLGFSSNPDWEAFGKPTFTSDDEPLDEKIREKLAHVRKVEDALLLKTGHGRSSLRDGWATWFDQKGMFLRRDRMLRSSFEQLNSMHNPLLQDPDMPGITSLTRGDKTLQKTMWREILASPFGYPISQSQGKLLEDQSNKGTVRKLQYEVHANHEPKQSGNEDRQIWDYRPGIDSDFTFSRFMTHFLEMQRCHMRVFMVWNSPPWMFGVRHQRTLESILFHHPNACIVVFSETLEADFFSSFTKNGFKVAVVMPNLDELLKKTPVHSFSSMWHTWRKLHLYPVHYSELVRLVALYKYGGGYLDFDVVVLRKLHFFQNMIAIRNLSKGNTTFSGAVMIFKKHSPFVWECLREFRSTYDGTRFRWNGADLLTRVVKRLKATASPALLNVQIMPSFIFFPIQPENILRYFISPVDTDAVHQKELFQQIIVTSYTLHLWNTISSSRVPELDSLVERFLSRYCLFCLDLL